MSIAPNHPNVDTNGNVRHEYLNDWKVALLFHSIYFIRMFLPITQHKYKYSTSIFVFLQPGCDLPTLVQILRFVFSEKTPLYARPQQQQPPPQTQSYFPPQSGPQSGPSSSRRSNLFSFDYIIMYEYIAS